MNEQDYESPTEGDNDDEFGAPEDVKIDVNRQINHLMQSFSNDNIQLHWKISQHAAEIDALKIALAEEQATVDAQTQLLKEYAGRIIELEGEMVEQRWTNASPADDPQSEDAFLQMSGALSGQPGLASSPPAAPAPEEESATTPQP